MKVSIITPNYNGERYIEKTLRSVLAQREEGLDLEYIVVDGASKDRSMEILRRYGNQIDKVISEPDRGPASAIIKGLNLATGDLIGWLNADDLYHPGALKRALATMELHPEAALCFGRCRIVDEEDREIRRGITLFKEAFFPFSCHFMIQSINYISQPAMFFRRSALQKAGPLREDMKAAFDYDFILRLWRQGGACRIAGPPVSDFRWHPTSISGTSFDRQFKEEFEVVVADAGRCSLQTLIHWCVRWGIVFTYSLMQNVRIRKSKS
jgi:glycosyltransferase involved in cell wall biosynthesis